MEWDALAMAIEALSWMELRRINERLALRRVAKQLNIRDPLTIRHAFRLIMEATRMRNTLDHLVLQTLDIESFENLSLGVLSFLRIYVSEVKYGDVSYEEAVEMARGARRILGSRELAPIEEALDLIHPLEINFQGLSYDETIALRTFHPSWYVKYCSELLGREEALRLMQAPNPPNYIRINPLKGVEEETLESLRQEGLRLKDEKKLGQTFSLLAQEQPLTMMKAYLDGLFTIQDKASVLAGLVASPEPGETVLDVCAAPGGKTGHMAQLMENKGEILSVDFSERRLKTWKGEMAWLGVENAIPILGDARKSKDLPDIEVDVVLVDPPCTGTGTFNRIPSGKWRLTRRSIDRMASIQRSILDNCAEHVKQGGTLVYCTCSVTVEENELVIRAFLKAHVDFKLVASEPRIGAQGLRGQIENQRLYPHIHRCNGFYISKLARF
jgi:16S rRNA (cytosine967-C5)-methyltransferase